MKWKASIPCVRCGAPVEWACWDFPGTYEIPPDRDAEPGDHGCEWSDEEYEAMQDAALHQLASPATAALVRDALGGR